LARQTRATERDVYQALRELNKELPSTDTASESASMNGQLKSSPQNVPTSPSEHPHRPWPLLIIGLAAAVAVWSGWVGLGQMTGFGVISLLPGIWDGLRINTAVVLPVSVEAYAAYALRIWLGIKPTTHTRRTLRFARNSAIISLVIGAVAQVAYHLMSAAGYTRAPWPIVMLVAIVPVAVLGLASALAKLVTKDTD
jgi:hypothetical protein